MSYSLRTEVCAHLASLKVDRIHIGYNIQALKQGQSLQHYHWSASLTETWAQDLDVALSIDTKQLSR